ncbi:sensor histidine kinase RegB [Cochlodiniinecator piscidefendens]|uniref:sensor histidine kinase RegB n=1 Tax=Cochlodiniinecator piscidefendens TaxID=2715756 RepID=UPI001407D991|nr:ActS/PrrB/RegB family redox-sensitive histidine kinase [Cochlodiniinecator piscidefendens]
MTDQKSALFDRDTHSNWLRLRTLIVLRWVAIIGQIVAITIAQRIFNLTLDLGLVYLVVSISVVANLIFIFVFPENKRLSELQSVLMLLFDITQLALLLFLTGGLHNPFALLIVAPVTISATVLHIRSTVLLGAISLVLITLLMFYHIQLRTEEGFILRMPTIFLRGFWVAIVIGTVFLGIYARRVTSEIHSMSEALLATQMALSREQKLTDLGGVIAAAAHELGTPLATIKLVSAELIEEVKEQPELLEDVELIRDQANRCREILHSMGRAGKDDLHLRSAPFEAVIQEAAEPHINRGIHIHFDFYADDLDDPQPILQRQPELIHGVRNLIQNAVDFAESNVWVEGWWDHDRIQLQIIDDGKGYAPHVIGRIGDPFMRRRRSASHKSERPGYEGMGLGLFIAKTLLERSGAELTFANGSDPFLNEDDRPEKCGAIVEVVWNRENTGPEHHNPGVPLGNNQPIRA